MEKSVENQEIKRKYIYKITCLVNDKVYIGQSNDPSWRWQQHVYYSNNIQLDSQVISRAIAKHGVGNFTFEVLCSCITFDINDVNETECRFIKEYDSTNPEKGYNVDPGGSPAITHSPEIRAKISASLNKFYSENENSRKGIPLTEEHKRNLSISSMGKPGTNAGKVFDDEWRRNMSEAQSGKDRLGARRFSAEVEKEIATKYENNISAYELAKVYDCPKSLVLDILARNGVTTRSGKAKIDNNTENKLCELYKAGNTNTASLAEITGISKPTVRAILLRNGIVTKVK